ncbi:4'-phosphopantetheinyl transferase superfamily protein [Microvirga sp. VF16]|uniref:4'-phosphopantetheinyl transferase family protein n=1 Tax=Microvirga sp. VF16 TaxID=2807101 RepID=UPI00193E00D3|nr:4'-phosphopantetheinyl transferase superfamily protein [Microvirga sp. VF16]QRM32606.1 4'-phosphopantetheinyl transferase superfamily protein [Microvirga sp. VF16]
MRVSVTVAVGALDLDGACDDLRRRRRAEPACVAVFVAHQHVLGAYPDIESLLSHDERRSIARQQRETDRRVRAAAHGLKRLLVARLLDVHAAALRFGREPTGRPLVLEADSIDISLAHDDDWVALAIGLNARVGVDVERDDPAIDWDLLAAEFLAPEERQRMAGLGPHDRRQFVLERWCQLEAYAKMTGKGLSQSVVTSDFAPRAQSTRLIGDGRWGACAWWDPSSWALCG